jgi:hypothetical protein
VSEHLPLAWLAEKYGVRVMLTSRPEAPFSDETLVGLEGVCLSEELDECVVVSVPTVKKPQSILEAYSSTTQVPCRVQWLTVNVEQSMDTIARACWRKLVERSGMEEGGIPINPDDCPRLRAPVDQKVFLLQADGYVIGTGVESQTASEDLLDTVHGWCRIAAEVLGPQLIKEKT